LDEQQSKLSNLALHASTGLHGGLELPMSVVNDFYASQAFADFTKSLESRRNFNEALMAGFGSLHKAIGAVVHAIGKLAEITAKRGM
jgi:hypothetical protein